MTSKASLRQSLLALRRKINPAERQAAAENAANLFIASDFFRQSQHIACYYPRADEFDCLPIVQKIWAAGKKCYLPLLESDGEKNLIFASYSPNDTLQPNRYQILEPKKGQIIALEKLNLVLFPLVAFDLSGRRLGMGAGYYDRTFATLRSQKNQTCHLIGLAYDAQQQDVLPEDPWDVALDGVVTESRLIIF